MGGRGEEGARGGTLGEGRRGGVEGWSAMGGYRALAPEAKQGRVPGAGAPTAAGGPAR